MQITETSITEEILKTRMLQP